MSVAYLHEAYVIGLKQDPKVIQSYSFGGEAMINHGGYHYSNPELYAKTVAVAGVQYLAVTILMAAALWFRKWPPFLLALALLALGALYDNAEEGRNWERRGEFVSAVTSPVDSRDKNRSL